MKPLDEGNAEISLLCADDEPEVRDVLRSMISRKFPGIKLHLADNGRIGLELYKEHTPQIVITDISMPVMSGIKMAREIKTESPETIIIAVTAHRDARYLLDAIEIGINHYLIKPFDLQKLISLIRKSVAEIKLRRQLIEQENEILRLSSFPQLSPNPILELDADGNVTFRNLAAGQIEEDAGKCEGNHSFIPENLPEILRIMQTHCSEQHELEIELNGEIYAEHIQIVPQFNTIRIYATNITKRKLAEKELRESEKRYMELSITDSLTNLFNSRHFYDRLQNEVERANRYSHPLSLLLLDIDNFKKYNDTYGHLEGNTVLTVLSDVIRNNLRHIDTAYRYGGEEFTVLLPETECESALLVAERIRQNFERVEFSPLPESRVHMTVSIGVGQYVAGESVTSFIKRVDACMYTAKRLGKNQINHACPVLA